MDDTTYTATHAAAIVNRRTVLRRGVIGGGFGLALLTGWLRPGSVDAREAATPSPVASPTVVPEIFAVFGQRGTTREGWPIEIVLAPPEYLRLAGREADIVTFDAEHALVILTSRRHDGALKELEDAFSISVRIDAQTPIAPTERRTLRDERGVRDDAFIFRAVLPGVLAENHLLEVLLPANESEPPISMPWITPLVTPRTAGTNAGPTATPGDAPLVDVLETVMPSGDIDPC